MVGSMVAGIAAIANGYGVREVKRKVGKRGGNGRINPDIVISFFPAHGNTESAKRRCTSPSNADAVVELHRILTVLDRLQWSGNCAQLNSRRRESRLRSSVMQNIYLAWCLGNPSKRVHTHCWCRQAYCLFQIVRSTGSARKCTYALSRSPKEILSKGEKEYFLDTINTIQ